MGWRRTRRRRAGASQLTRAARKGTLWPAHGEQPAAAVWHRSRACIPHTCPGAAFFRLHSNTGPWGRTGAAAAAAAAAVAAAAAPRRRLHTARVQPTDSPPTARRQPKTAARTAQRQPTTARRQCNDSATTGDASASASACVSSSGSDSEQRAQPVLRVCDPTHPRSTILANPLERSKDGSGSGSSNGSSGSADGAGGSRTAFFLFVCCALV